MRSLRSPTVSGIMHMHNEVDTNNFVSSQSKGIDRSDKYKYIHTHGPYITMALPRSAI